MRREFYSARDQLVEAQEDPSQVIRAIKDLNAIAQAGFTALDKVVKQLFINPDPALLDAEELGISDDELNYVKAMINAYGSTDEIRQMIDETELGGSVRNKQKELDELQEAINFMDTTILGDPMLQEDQKFMSDSLGIVETLITTTDEKMVIENPFNEAEMEQEKKQYFVIEFDPAKDTQNVVRLQKRLEC